MNTCGLSCSKLSKPQAIASIILTSNFNGDSFLLTVASTLLTADSLFEMDFSFSVLKR